MTDPSPRPPRQAVVTVASGPHAERLDHTFTSFNINPNLELHAFIIGNQLPKRQLPGITYHLTPEDGGYQLHMREIYYRRFLLLDELDVQFALVVDNHDVLCMQPIPPLEQLLRGAAVGGCVEHEGGRYIAGQQYTSSYINAGATFWNIPASRKLREEYGARGRSCFRSVEDQLTLNELLHTTYYDDLILLPCQYNYRPCLAPMRVKNWPTVDHLDGIRIYHNVYSLEAARALRPVSPKAQLAGLPADRGPLTPSQVFWRRVRNRLLQRHLVRWYSRFQRWT